MRPFVGLLGEALHGSISGLVVEYIVAIDVTRVRFPADAFSLGSGAARVGGGG